MTREDRILFLSTRQDFLPRHQEAVEALCLGREIAWKRLAAAAERHGVLPIVGHNLRRCRVDLPPETAERLELAVFESAAVRERDADRLAAAIHRLREVSLDVMLLKSAALGLSVYREPWVVTSRDIDLALRPGPGWELEKGEAVRLALYSNGIECDLGGHHDVTMNGVLPIDFESLWRDAQPVLFRGAEAWRTSNEDLLISLAVNACRKRFFRLKGLFDLAETVGRVPLDWRLLAAKARASRCEGIVHAALLAARETLGCDLPAGALEGLGVPRLKVLRLRALISGFLRYGSVVEGRGETLLLALSYASFRPPEAWKSLRYSVTHPPPHREPEPEEWLTPPATSTRS
jgi:hypothetical protein